MFHLRVSLFIIYFFDHVFKILKTKNKNKKVVIKNLSVFYKFNQECIIFYLEKINIFVKNIEEKRHLL